MSVVLKRLGAVTLEPLILVCRVTPEPPRWTVMKFSQVTLEQYEHCTGAFMVSAIILTVIVVVYTLLYVRRVR